jgi:hypothetical protein
MATILEFRSDMARAQRGVSGAPQTTGKIVIFPGIRVSYWDDLASVPDELPPAPKAEVKRKAKVRRRK